ncbi:MAG: helix-turn-helix domain-containing protein, partial [Nocardioides sp.]|uniref:PucR family transcriptional regulator n=1 Tax=Nocardioides sp. TaxID=35761 RepID=UPI0039E3E5E9
LARLGLAGRRVVVLAAALRRDRPAVEPPPESSDSGDSERVADALSVHLSASVPSSAVAVLGGVVHALVPVHQGATALMAEERAARLAEEFCERLGSRLPVVVAVGPASAEVSGVTASRATAVRVLRVLREGHAQRRVARLVDVHTQALLLELRDLAAARGERPVGPIARLLEYDERNDSGLAETLEVWLDALGDVRAASAALFIHPNTLRYRLRRLEEVSGLDLADPEQRFAAMLQLRILAPR